MLAATDAALILLHLVTGLDAFDLEQEANLSSWYSSVKLLGIAAMSAAVAARRATGCLFMILGLNRTTGKQRPPGKAARQQHAAPA